MPSANQLMTVIHIQTEIAKLGLDLGGVMQLVVEETIALIDADGAVIELTEGDDMVYRAAAGMATPQIGLRVDRHRSLSGLCVTRGEMMRSDDSELDPRVDRQACRLVGLRSMIVMPLKHQGVSIGVLKAMSRQPNKFSQPDEVLLGLLSEAVSAAMYFASKYDMEDLYYRATHDGLTGLANRSVFMDRLRNELSRNSRDRNAFGVLMIDMDGLKQINDSCGHRIGDAVIQEFAHRIKSDARHSDTIARLGGDEFGVILTPVEIPLGIDAAVARLRQEIAQPFLFEGTTYHLRASIGTAQYPLDGDDAIALLELADKRMYAEKEEHRRQQLVTIN